MNSIPARRRWLCRQVGTKAMEGVAWALAAVLLAAVPTVGFAAQFVCAGSNIAVSGGARTDRKSACAATRDALSFLKEMGLDFQGRMTIEFVENFPGDEESCVIGKYESRSNEIQLLAYQPALLASHTHPSAFGIPMSRELWRSFVIHEITHAVVDQHFAPGRQKFTASEYIAAVVQLATLSPAVREKIFKNYPGISGFDNQSEITALFYYLDPGRFAVKSYLHFMKPENGPGFVKRLLEKGLPF